MIFKNLLKEEKAWREYLYAFSFGEISCIINESIERIIIEIEVGVWMNCIWKLSGTGQWC